MKISKGKYPVPRSQPFDKAQGPEPVEGEPGARRITERKRVIVNYELRIDNKALLLHLIFN